MNESLLNPALVWSDRPSFNTPLPLGWKNDSASASIDGIYLIIDGFAVPAGDSNRNFETSNTQNQNRALVQLYKREGAEFLKRLRGSFAIALWDAARKQLILAVDHFGTRPLYYWCDQQKVAFARQIACFRPCGAIRQTIDPNSVYFYLNHSFIPAPSTIYREIKRLEPGQYLSWQNGRLTSHQYWDMSYPESRDLDERSAADLVRSSVEESLRFLLQNETHSIEQLGAFLSGGTDSSTLVGLMSRLTGAPMKTFSVGFDELPYNEIRYARVAAARFNSDAHESFVHPREALDSLQVLAREYEEPFGNSSAIPTYFCLKMAREAGIRVMFAGDGGDELFAGNDRYLTEKIFSLYWGVPQWLRKPTNAAANHIPSVYPLSKIKTYIYKANLPVADRFFHYQLFFRDHATAFFTDEFRQSLDPDFPLAAPRKHYERAGEISLLNRLLYMDLKLAIADNDLIKVNRMAQAQGIQVRYPYLDPHVATVSGMIPSKLKLKGWAKRYVFKKAFAELLPREILRKKKHGFGLPTGDWLRSDSGFRDFARALLLDNRSVQRGYFKRSAVEDLLRKHDRETTNYYASHIWNFMMLELWHRTHVDRLA